MALEAVAAGTLGGVQVRRRMSLQINKGGRGVITTSRICYGCHESFQKDGNFSSTQWQLAESKLRRCQRCINSKVTATAEPEESEQRVPAAAPSLTTSQEQKAAKDISFVARW